MTNDNCNLFCFMCCRLTTSMLVVGRGSVFWAVHSKALILPRQCLLVEREECGSEGILWGGCQAGVWCSPPHFPRCQGRHVEWGAWSTVACSVVSTPIHFLLIRWNGRQNCVHSNEWEASRMYSVLYCTCKTQPHTYPHPHTHTHIYTHSPTYIYMYIICSWWQARFVVCNGLPQKVYSEMCRVLAAIHRVNIEAVDLSDFGKHGVWLYSMYWDMCMYICIYLHVCKQMTCIESLAQFKYCQHLHPKA